MSYKQTRSGGAFTVAFSASRHPRAPTGGVELLDGAYFQASAPLYLNVVVPHIHASPNRSYHSPFTITAITFQHFGINLGILASHIIAAAQPTYEKD